MSNTNLFYSLYSTSNDKITTNYKCSSAIDESDTSFDISDETGTITDSNGNTLASIDLSSIHEADITLYNCETRIILPYSTYVLLGLEYGYAYTTYYFRLPKLVIDIEGYEYYMNMLFDIFYDNIQGPGLHIAINGDGTTDICTLLNNEFTTDNIKVSASILELEDPADKLTYQYLVFMSLANTFFYYIRNLVIMPIFISEDFPNSPFSDLSDTILTETYELLEQYHPLLPNTVYDEDTYEVNCDLYEWMILNYYDILDLLDKFKEVLDYINPITKDTSTGDIDIRIAMANLIYSKTIYDNDIINAYDDDNMYIIYEVIYELKKKWEASLIPTKIMLKEDVKRRIPIMKYPNGAFRGIVIVPDYPTNTDDYDYASLWIHHIKDTATLLEPITISKDTVYKKKEVGVLANATLVTEQCDNYNILSNINNFTPVIEDGYEDSSDCEDFVIKGAEDDNVVEPVIFMGRSYYSKKESVIGLYRYLQYVSDENLWVKMGDAYMIIGKDDDPLEKTKNLPSSLLIYNPNDVPIRIKYLIFS